MFTALADILGKNETIDISISAPDEQGRMKVIVKPKLSNDKTTVLAQPLALAATPQEFDTDFVGVLMQYSAERTSLAKQVEITSTILQESKAAESKKATKALTKKGAGHASPAEAEAEGEDEDEDDNILTPAPNSPAEVKQSDAVPDSVAKPAANQTDDLLALMN